jgi:hypothetical protein
MTWVLGFDDEPQIVRALSINLRARSGRPPVAVRCPLTGAKHPGNLCER